MARLRGTGLGTGMVMGTAAIVRMRNGFPLTPAIPERIIQLMAQRKLTEKPDIILVAEEYAAAANIADSVRWANVVGIAAATSRIESPLDAIPAVVNVTGLLANVVEDSLMVVDADRGVVVADPDSMAAAQYAAEHTNLAPKTRLYLDDTHLPAETTDGRIMQVLASVRTSADVTAALENGADALYIPYDAPLIPADVDDPAQRDNLLDLVSLAANKPLILADDYRLNPMVILEAATHADILIAVPVVPHLDGMGIGELAFELNEAQAECLENDQPAEMPRLAVYLPKLPPGMETEQPTAFVEKLAGRGATRLILTLDEGTLDEAAIPLLDTLIAAAAAHLLPVFVSASQYYFTEREDSELADDMTTALRFLLGTGAAGLLVDPYGVQTVKMQLREMNFSECRDFVSAFVRGMGNPVDVPFPVIRRTGRDLQGGDQGAGNTGA